MRNRNIGYPDSPRHHCKQIQTFNEVGTSLLLTAQRRQCRLKGPYNPAQNPERRQDPKMMLWRVVLAPERDRQAIS